MLPIALGLLLGAVTIAQGGKFFQPALSRDGTRVAYAADEGGTVSIFVADTVSATAKVKVATLGEGPLAYRLAVRSLAHQPWSPDSTRLLFVKVGPDRESELLYVVTADGGEPTLASRDRGLVESASWLASGQVAYTLRESRRDDVQRVYTADPLRSDLFKEVRIYSQGTLAVDLAPSPDGQWFGLVTLGGDRDDVIVPRDERKRQVRVLDEQGRDVRVEHSQHGNFLCWSATSDKLFFLDTATREVRRFAVREGRDDPPLARGMVAVVAVDDWIIGAEADGTLYAVSQSTGDKSQPLTAGYIPVSATPTRLALLRPGEKDTAIVVTTISKEAIEAGDIGMPKPESPPPPVPPPPAEGGGGKSGSASGGTSGS